MKKKLDDSQAAFVYSRVAYANDKESQREKFVFITWIGSGVKVMRKAKVRLRTRPGLFIGSC